MNDLYFIRDKDDAVYWTKFESDELQQTNGFTKSVRIGRQPIGKLTVGSSPFNYDINRLILVFSVEVCDDELHFEDLSFKYRIDLANGRLSKFPYNSKYVNGLLVFYTLRE